MKKYELLLKENEELIVDVDDTMEKELDKFKENIKDLNDAELKIFNNWIKIYKLLNYDVFEGLTIDKIYKFNEYGCVVELTFKGKKEYDLLNLNPETMTVSCMSVKTDSIRNYTVRRLLVPDTVDNALAFAKSMIPEDGLQTVGKLISELQVSGIKYDVTNQLNLNNTSFIRCPEFKEDLKGIKREDPRADFTYSYSYKRKEEPKKESTYSYVYKRKETPKVVKQEPKQKIKQQEKPKVVKQEPKQHTIDVIMESVTPDGQLDIINLISNVR